MTHQKRTHYLHIGLHALAFLVGGNRSTAKPQPAASIPKEHILKADVDDSVNPGADFFQYANGSWLKRNPIPASESSWGIANLVREELYTQLRSINEASAKKTPTAGTDEQK